MYIYILLWGKPAVSLKSRLGRDSGGCDYVASDPTTPSLPPYVKNYYCREGSFSRSIKGTYGSLYPHIHMSFLSPETR